MSFGRPYILNIEGCIHDGWLRLYDFQSEAKDEFLYYLLSSSYVQRQYESFAAGSGVQNLNKEVVKKVNVILPSIPEQEEIARTLSQFDTYIDDLAELIEKKKGIRDGALEDLITKKTRLDGFDDDWTSVTFNQVITPKARIGWQGLKKHEYLRSGYSYLIGGTDFSNGTVSLDNISYVTKERYDMDTNIQVSENDVLVTKDGTIGKVAIVPELNKPATLNSGVFVFRTNSRLVPAFLFRVLQSSVFREFIDTLSAGSTIKHLQLPSCASLLSQTDATCQQAIHCTLSDLNNFISLCFQISYFIIHCCQYRSDSFLFLRVNRYLKLKFLQVLLIQMATVDAEKKLQKRVLHWLVNDLGYTYLGNLEDIDNTPVKEDLLKANLKKRGYSDDQIKTAISELLSKVNNQVDTLYQINRSVYSLLRYGRQGVKDEYGRRETVHYIEWDTDKIDENDFYIAEEVSVLRYDRVTRKRPDVVLYINGIALGVFELKSSYVSAGKGIRQMLQNQKRENILNFFGTAQFLFAGNEAEGLFYGTTDTPEKYYLKWKEDKKATDKLSADVKLLQVKEVNRLRDGVISLCHKERFLSLIHDFVIYDAGIKKVTRHNQYFANIAARKRILENEGGIIWNTQGSGKSLIMVWLTKWIIENINDSRVVIITDRDELDDQIESLFIDVEEKVRRAKSCADLRSILDKNEDAIVCSLIHKYGHNAGSQSDIDQYRKELLKNLPKDISAKGNIVAFIDECHRTNSGKLHEAVKVLMPNAVLIGFTGTPLLKTDKQTSLETFGTYIHTYKFDEGVEDGVVLDLRYEARDVDQDLSSQDKVDLWFENKTHGLTERAKQQLKQSWTSINKLYSSKQRLEKIASDIVFDMSLKPRLKEERGTAMLVANSIYEACRYWEIFMSMGFTKCAVVTSYEPTTQSVRTATTDPNQASEDEYKKAIYERMLGGKKLAEYEKEAKERFKHEPAKMKLLIVVDKLLTGFDAPSATYLYIDKSMRDHDLFQAICRVNRPDGDDKDYGYIVD